jgi:hypothetical protein
MRRLIFASLAVGFALACGPAAMGSSGNPGGGLVTIPFHASFYTEQVGDLVVDGCDPGVAINTQAGAGEATHIGRFTTWMVFCFDLNAPPALGTYWFLPGVGGENGRFVAADGDELWITVNDGFVDFSDPNLPDGYQASFQDPFLFTGGTGRFEGASGGGQINSLVGLDGRTDHEWTGELVVRRGR